MIHCIYVYSGNETISIFPCFFWSHTINCTMWDTGMLTRQMAYTSENIDGSINSGAGVETVLGRASARPQFMGFENDTLEVFISTSKVVRRSDEQRRGKSLSEHCHQVMFTINTGSLVSTQTLTAIMSRKCLSFTTRDQL